MNALQFMLKSRELGSSSSEVICRAAQAFGALKEPRAVAPLSRLLAHKDSSVRKAAIGALGQIGRPDAVRALARALATPGQRDWWEIIASLDASDGNWRQSEAARSVVPEVVAAFPRLEAIFAAGAIGDSRAVEPLLRLSEQKIPVVGTYDYENINIISYAVSALGRIHDARAFEFLLQQAQSGRPWASEAIGALGGLGNPRAIPALVAMLRADRPACLSSTVTSLLQLGWQPESASDEAWVAVVKKDWAALEKLGAAAVGPLAWEITELTGDEVWRTLDRLGEPHATMALSLLKSKVSNQLPEWVKEETWTQWNSLACDICGRRAGGGPKFRIERWKFRFIVRVGYNPFATGRISSSTWLANIVEGARKGTMEDVMPYLLASDGLASQNPEDAYLKWRRDLVERSTTDWVLCASCVDDVKGFAEVH